MADLSQLSDEQLQVYRDLLAQKQGSSAPAANGSASPMDRIASSPGWDQYLKQHHVTPEDISGPVMMGTPVVSPAANGAGILRSMAPSLAGYVTGAAAHGIGLPDYASIPLSIGAGMLTHGVGGVVSDPDVQDAAFKFSPFSKAVNLGKAIFNHFRTPESTLEMPSMTGISNRPDYSDFVRPAASAEPYQSTVIPEPGPGLWSKNPIKSPQVISVTPTRPPLMDSGEQGPGFSGTRFPSVTGRGQNPQTTLSSVQPKIYSPSGTPGPDQYTFVGGNQFRIPSTAGTNAVAPPPVAEPSPSGVVRIGQTPAERIQSLSQSPEGTLGTRAEMMRQLRLSDIHGTASPEKAAIIRRFESPEYTPRERQFIDPRESQIIAPPPVQESTDIAPNGKRNQLK